MLMDDPPPRAHIEPASTRPQVTVRNLGKTDEILLRNALTARKGLIVRKQAGMCFSSAAFFQETATLSRILPATSEPTSALPITAKTIPGVGTTRGAQGRNRTRSQLQRVSQFSASL